MVGFQQTSHLIYPLDLLYRSVQAIVLFDILGHIYVVNAGFFVLSGNMWKNKPVYQAAIVGLGSYPQVYVLKFLHLKSTFPEGH